ncbi:aspartokinase [Candidatus Vecturithrix granuli]|uniref:Aspartokinase n=1 Tax=Vecturithrix granuli TaxID=1499967 RepID=A0A081C808_VECG1|nr:aspartokinase [Candidatus Vecturithrix granuli]
MSLVVQKFGGTSVATPQARDRLLHHVKQCQAEGHEVVLVVSAMGRKGDPYATDTLIGLLEQIDPHVDLDKKDLLMSCGEIISCALLSHFLEVHGIPAEPLTGYQARILTTDAFSQSDILNIDTTVIKNYLSQGKVVVLAGFQGVTWDGKITTLGRGGSDTTAVELGGYLRAQRVDIFTDVPGVAIVDPRIVPDAAYLENISYAEMYQLAAHGAKVIHPRAVKAAEKFALSVYVRSTFSDERGTLISSTPCTTTKKIFGMSLDAEMSCLTIKKEDCPIPDFEKQGIVLYTTQEDSYHLYLKKEHVSRFLANVAHSRYEYMDSLGRLSVFFHPENREEIGVKTGEYFTQHKTHIHDVFWFDNYTSIFVGHEYVQTLARDLYQLF